MKRPYISVEPSSQYVSVKCHIRTSGEPQFDSILLKSKITSAKNDESLLIEQAF